jgi:hypothetical protein
MICTGTCGNGARTGGLIVCPVGMLLTRRFLVRARSASFGEASGPARASGTLRVTAVQRTGTTTSGPSEATATASALSWPQVSRGRRAELPGAGWRSAYAPPLMTPTATSAPRMRVNERRERPHVIGQFLALIAQGLKLGLGGWIREREAANLAVCVSERNGSVVGT